MIIYQVECDNCLYKPYSKKACRKNKRESTFFFTYESAAKYAGVMKNSIIKNIAVCD